MSRRGGSFASSDSWTRAFSDPSSGTLFNDVPGAVVVSAAVTFDLWFLEVDVPLVVDVRVLELASSLVRLGVPLSRTGESWPCALRRAAPEAATQAEAAGWSSMRAASCIRRLEGVEGVGIVVAAVGTGVVMKEEGEEKERRASCRRVDSRQAR